MKHNTSTLGYKVLSGKLSENRKHSEQLNKYVAGLIDADGCLCLVFRPCKDKFSINLTFNFTQAFSNDPDGTLIKSIKKFYNIGSVSYRNLLGENTFSSIVVWYMGSKDSIKFLSLIGKHLRIKGTHFDNLIWLYKELQGCRLSQTNIEELKDFSKCSRDNSRWIKFPKHLSFAWMGGYLDGDGHYRFRCRRKFVKSYGNFCDANELSVQISCDSKDGHIIEKITEDIGGHWYNHKQGHLIWKMALGKTSSVYALKFLKQMRKYSCLEKKYSIIEEMILFHEDYQQRLNKNNAKA